MKTKKIILFVFVLALGFIIYQAGYYFGKETALKTPPAIISNVEAPELPKADFSVFWEAWRRLESDFLDKSKIDYQKMIYGAAEGLVKSLGDPYTSFFNPEDTDEFEEELSGKYEGVGMEVGMKNGQITVISPFEGTPAYEAGIKPGDIILKINDQSTENIPLEEAVSRIRGERGSKVTLLIERESWDVPKPIILLRDVIKIPTFKWELKNTANGSAIAYIKFYQFNRILNKEFSQSASAIFSSPAKKIILDLRNNPGGYLDVAVDAAGWFLESNKTVVFQDKGKEEEKKFYKSSGPSKFKDYPLIVLINEGSASGAEILAGALRDIRGVKLVGEKSFGKGSVQEQVYLNDGSSLKITIAKWLTPNGYSINEQGLVPDIEISLSDEDWDQGRDPQLEKALEVIEELN